MRIATVLGLSLVGLVVAGGAVQAKPQPVPSCNAGSYMVLPDGRCLNLVYMGILAQARDIKTAADKNYAEISDANATLDSSWQYKLGETEKERSRRIEIEANARKVQQKASANNQSAEDSMWPIHQRAMTTVENAFKHP